MPGYWDHRDRRPRAAIVMRPDLGFAVVMRVLRDLD